METLKALIVGDLHCHPHDGDWQRVDDALEAFCWALDVYESEGCNHLFFCGDWEQKKGIVHKVIINRSRELIEFAAKRGVRMTFVVGNHDEPMVTDPDNAFGWISSNVAEVTRKPTVYRYADVDVYAVPYYGPPDRMRDILDEVAKRKQVLSCEKPSLFIGHLDVLGGMQSNSHKSEYGVTPSFLASNFRMSFLGHYHVRHSVADNVFYVGSLLTTKFNEEGQRGVTIYENGTYRFIPNTISPYHFTIDQSQINADRAKGNFIRVRTTQDSDTKTIESQLRDLGARKILMLPIDSVETSDDETGMVLLQKPSELSERAILGEWAKTNCPASLDPERLFNMGAEILAKVGL